MRRELFYTLGIVVVVSLAVTARPANAQTTATGPYYATPSWDIKLQCDTQATCPRFIVLSNWDGAAVLDRETGLVWEKSPSTSRFTWLNAHVHCNQMTTGGRLGWRLPTVQDLASLVDPGVAIPAITLPVGHPFINVEDVLYWTATIAARGSDLAWHVRFDGSNRASLIAQGVGLPVWCVRGGQGVDAQ